MNTLSLFPWLNKLWTTQFHTVHIFIYQLKKRKLFLNLCYCLINIVEIWVWKNLSLNFFFKITQRSCLVCTHIFTTHHSRIKNIHVCSCSGYLICTCDLWPFTICNPPHPPPLSHIQISVYKTQSELVSRAAVRLWTPWVFFFFFFFFFCPSLN